MSSNGTRPPSWDREQRPDEPGEGAPVYIPGRAMPAERGLVSRPLPFSWENSPFGVQPQDGGGTEPAVEPGTWDAVASILQRRTSAPSGTVATRAAASGNSVTPVGAPTEQDETGLLQTCQAEHAAITRELEELRLLEKQTNRELEQLNHRKVLTAASVREMEERIEHYARKDIRMRYLLAAEAEMRAFLMAEQREQLAAKIQAHERYANLLARILAVLSASDTNSASDFSGSLMEALASGPRPATASPNASLAGLPALTGPIQPGAPGIFAQQTAPLDPPARRHAATVRANSLRTLQVQEEERRRVAQRLHDGIAQALANVVLTAEICEKSLMSEPRRALGELGQLKRIVNSALQETRSFIFELRPMTLDDLGVCAALRRYAADLTAKYGTHVAVNAPQGERRLPQAIEVPLFRIAQEALLNAAQHARASHIRAILLYPDGGLVLTVHDDGIGFNVEQALALTTPGETTGLAGMRERAEMLGGWLRIQSLAGHGTQLELSIPLPPQEPVPYSSRQNGYEV